MSLLKSLTILADEMMKDAQAVPVSDGPSAASLIDEAVTYGCAGRAADLRLAAYASTLRLLIITAVDPAPEVIAPRTKISSEVLGMAAKLMVEAKNKTDLQERSENVTGGGTMLYAYGGNADGDLVPCDPAMPPGARIPLSGHWYIHRDGALHYSEEETTKRSTAKVLR